MDSDIGQSFGITVTNQMGSTNYTIKFENPTSGSLLETYLFNLPFHPFYTLILVGLSSGAVAGIVIGVLVLVALIGFGVYYFLFKVKKVGLNKKKKAKKIGTPSSSGQPNLGADH